MNTWYDNLTDILINELKNNTVPFGLSPLKNLISQIPFELREYWTITGGGSWQPDCNSNCGITTVFRLRPDWYPPSTHPSSCFQSYDVLEDQITSGYFSYRGWVFIRNAVSASALPLHMAMSMKGFVGFEFEGVKGWHLTLQYREDRLQCERYAARPIRVWFDLESC